MVPEISSTPHPKLLLIKLATKTGRIPPGIVQMTEVARASLLMIRLFIITSLTSQLLSTSDESPYQRLVIVHTNSEQVSCLMVNPSFSLNLALASSMSESLLSGCLLIRIIYPKKGGNWTNLLLEVVGMISRSCFSRDTLTNQQPLQTYPPKQ